MEELTRCLIIGTHETSLKWKVSYLVGANPKIILCSFFHSCM